VTEHVAHHDIRQPVAHGGDRVAAALQAYGVRLLFTLCGGHISPILVGAKARGLRVLDVRDEATSVFAADAVARLTGAPGVAAVTAGPGVTNMLTALKNAQLAQSPVVVLGGAAPTALQGRGALQDIEQGPIVAPHVKLVKRVRRVRDLTPALEEAFATARDGVPGPVFVECPVDLLYEEASVRVWYREASGKGTSIPVVPTSRRLATPRIFSSVLQPYPVARHAATIGLLRSAPAIVRVKPRLHHQRRDALRESDCVVLADVPCDFRLDCGRHIRRSSIWSG
jgi:hypothetical protein